jgi:hypothetical protein
MQPIRVRRPASITRIGTVAAPPGYGGRPLQRPSPHTRP